ncbi:uncharacterized protein ACR2FA_010305 [Aphomia sociella]
MWFLDPIDLIEEVKKRPGLYSLHTPADREEKVALWKEVGAAIYNDEWDSYSRATAYDKVLQLQRKWRSLRDAYARELRARRTGVRVNKRVYRYFGRMSFLGGFSETVSETDEVLEDHSSSSNIADEEDHFQKVVKVKKPRKKRRREPSAESVPALEELEMPTFPIETVNEVDCDTNKLFLLSFLPEIRGLPLHIKMWVRTQIAKVMQEAVNCQINNIQPGTSSDKNGMDLKRQRHDSTD